MKMSEDHAGEVLDVENNIEIIECLKCEFRHALVPNDPQSLYTSHYYDAEKPGYITSNESESHWWDLTYGERINMVDSLSAYPVVSWIDIGTGPGLFLDALKVRNKKGVGVEPSLQAFNHAQSKGHNVVNSHFDSKIANQLGEFDAAHLSEVLEHVPNPFEFLKSVNGAIKPGGFICVVVPNDYNPIQEVFVKTTSVRKWWIAPPFHLNYFDRSSLEKLLEKTGFEVVHSTVMFPIDFFLLMGDNYIESDEIGKIAHARRKNFENAFKYADSLEIMRRIYEALAKIGIGRELVVFAKKVK